MADREPTAWVVVWGDLSSGIDGVHGPFTSEQLAYDYGQYADDHGGNGPWVVLPLYYPEEEEAHDRDC